MIYVLTVPQNVFLFNSRKKNQPMYSLYKIEHCLLNLLWKDSSWPLEYRRTWKAYSYSKANIC